jgi:hypothetical protein
MFAIKFTLEAEHQFILLKTAKGKQNQFKAVGKAIAYMMINLRHPSLNTHKFGEIKSPFGGDVFESYAQNKTPGASSFNFYEIFH